MTLQRLLIIFTVSAATTTAAPRFTPRGRRELQNALNTCDPHIPKSNDGSGNLAQTPGSIDVGPWGGKVECTFPVPVEVVFDADLPNGPYADTINTFGTSKSVPKVYVPDYSDYNTVGKTLLDAWIQSRGSMINMHVRVAGMGPKYSEDWKLVSISYKGGNVDPHAYAKQGLHTVTLGLTQTTGFETGCKAAGCLCTIS